MVMGAVVVCTEVDVIIESSAVVIPLVPAVVVCVSDELEQAIRHAESVITRSVQIRIFFILRSSFDV